MSKHKFHLILILLIPAIFSCDEGNPGPIFIVPENLTLSVDNINDGSGTVHFTASATNAFFYEYIFGDNPSADPTRSDNGTITYNYTESGTYEAEVRAYGNTSEYINEIITIEVVVNGSTIIPSTGYSTPDTYDGMKLLWKDEFSGTAVDETFWTFEIGTGNWGWGNNELQYYRKENTYLIDGNLIIEARKESYGGSSYTSSRMITKDKFDFKYGRVDIRAALPKGQGIWPALWMLGSNISTVGWPACGEIDIMELIGGGAKDSEVHGTIHWDDNGHVYRGGLYTKSPGTFNDEFHVFSIIWTSTAITWYVNDIQFHTESITPASMSELHNSAFFIFNVAVGGNWPGSPDATTVFPQRMIVDYVRVFQDN